MIFNKCQSQLNELLLRIRISSVLLVFEGTTMHNNNTIYVKFEDAVNRMQNFRVIL